MKTSVFKPNTTSDISNENQKQLKTIEDEAGHQPNKESTIEDETGHQLNEESTIKDEAGHQLNEESTIEVDTPSTNSDNLNTFVIWRNNIMNNMSDTFELLNKYNFPGANEIKDQVKILPKCMVHLTKKMCNCDPNCVSESFKNFEFDKECSLFDLENVFTDDKYIFGCDKYDYRPIEGKLVKYKVGKNVNEAKENFYKAFNDLCEDESKINEAKVSAYELRDECFDDIYCLVNALNQKFSLDCKNKDFENNLKEISKIFDIELKISPYKELSDNQNSHGRNLRSIDEISTLENSNEIKNLNTSICTSFTVIGVLFLSFLGYLFIKNKKKNKF